MGGDSEMQAERREERGGEGQSRWGPVVRGGRETRVGAMDGGDTACGALPVLSVCVCLYVWE